MDRLTEDFFSILTKSQLPHGWNWVNTMTQKREKKITAHVVKTYLVVASLVYAAVWRIILDRDWLMQVQVGIGSLRSKTLTSNRRFSSSIWCRLEFFFFFFFWGMSYLRRNNTESFRPTQLTQTLILNED